MSTESIFGLHLISTDVSMTLAYTKTDAPHGSGHKNYWRNYSPIIPSILIFQFATSTSKTTMAPSNKKQKVNHNIGDVGVVLIQHWSQQVDELSTKLKRAEKVIADTQHMHHLLINRYHALMRDYNQSLFHNQQYQNTLIRIREHFENCVHWIPDLTQEDEVWAGYNRIVNDFNLLMEIDLTADTDLDSDED